MQEKILWSKFIPETFMFKQATLSDVGQQRQLVTVLTQQLHIKNLLFI
jgi:hypothetical protein